MNRVYNYSAFYVAEPFDGSNLGAYCTPDFCYYQTLKMWKGQDNSFPFYDAHQTTYDVRDDSDWEKTLKPRLHDRLRKSKNIILFLSSNTKDSRALHEEIDYGVCVLGLPVIVVYPELDKDEIVENGSFTRKVKLLWDRLPVFRNNMDGVPTVHIPLEKDSVLQSLTDAKLTIQHKRDCKRWIY